MEITPDRPKPTAEELGAYIKGTRVVHRQFGPGEEKRLALSIALRAGALKLK